MAELTNRERFQPCLLDRLTDDEPKKTEESRDKRVMSAAQMRRSVIRDLEWLLNSSQKFRPEELADYPHVLASTMNYGVPDLVGLTGAGIDPQAIERRMTEAVQRYEPRVLRRGLSVRVLEDREAYRPSAVVFEIRGEMWAQPLPEALYVKTSVDLETGQVSVQDNPYG